MLGNVAVLKSFNLHTSFRQTFSKDEILELFLSLFYFSSLFSSYHIWQWSVALFQLDSFTFQADSS